MSPAVANRAKPHLPAEFLPAKDKNILLVEAALFISKTETLNSFHRSFIF